MKHLFIFSFSIFAALSLISCISKSISIEPVTYNDHIENSINSDYEIRFKWPNVENINIATLNYTTIETKKNPIELKMNIYYSDKIDFNSKSPVVIIPIPGQKSMRKDYVDRAVMFASFGIPAITFEYLQISRQMILDNYSDFMLYINKYEDDLGIDTAHIAVFDAGGEVLITTEAIASMEPELSKGIVYGLFFYGTIDKKNINLFPHHIETVFYSGEHIKTLNDELDNVVKTLKDRGSSSELFILQGRNYMFEYNNNDQEIEDILRRMIISMKEVIE